MTKDEKIPKEAIHYKVCQSLAVGGAVGSATYPLVWFLFLLIERPYQQFPSLCLFLSIFYIVLPFIRYFGLIKQFESVHRKYPQFWFYGFFSITIILSLSWGIISAVVFITPSLEQYNLITLFALVGLVGGCTSTLQACRPLIITMLCSFLLPTVLALTFIENDFGIIIILGFVIYFIGAFFVSRAQYDNYLRLVKYSFTVESYSRRMEHLSTIDSLTGLKNRGYFDQTLAKTLENRNNINSQVSLLLLDIDHFKTINDTYGHVVGDICLRDFGALLRRNVKQGTDIAARYGGEEFGIILPDTKGEEALLFAEKLRTKVEGLYIETGSDDQSISFSVSIGVSSVDVNNNVSVDQFVSWADSALYQAKKSGRNMVVLSEAN